MQELVEEDKKFGTGFSVTKIRNSVVLIEPSSDKIYNFRLKGKFRNITLMFTNLIKIYKPLVAAVP